MQNQRLNDLFYSYIDQRCTSDEERELMQLFVDPSLEEQRKILIDECYDQLPEKFFMSDAQANTIFNNIVSDTPVVEMHPKGRITWTRVAAAVIILLLLSVGGYFYFNKNNEKQLAKVDTQEKRFKNDVAPGGNKAILTLADGSQIILDSAANGTLTQQGNTKVIKLDDGQLAYNQSGSNVEIFYNTVSTPKGGQFKIVLPDGSNVWLNAASSLRFPASFPGNERNVELTGEGYFEITKNAAKPFHVKVNDMQVEVLGTHFNINAYNDEDVIRTTLLEGSVKVLVEKGQRSTVIKPGQQAQFSPSVDGGIKVITADVDETVAWKNGFFQFSNAPIESIMRQVEKWYDIDVQYDSKVSQVFKGEVPRSVNITTLLKILESTGWVHFKIDGKKVTVIP